ncbi:hypothetical protein F1D05_11205 [Kribbella qitaiheensis]|uniref:Uncharacterized protein n=1 Tax=Kribbella qitaiheensis TaxID=1544730 RepID=A0A7G6WWJ1_9ACTN|nr:DUF6624 domain-containing protein [Kribbella qitaiheensis]QNE18356.1 hypothetical protein F1D05_11205 [Kribbella qitaiheensis]
MHEELRSELLGRLDADRAAVAALLASADEYRESFASRPEAAASIVWPYGLLEWAPAETAPATVRRVITVVHENTKWLGQIITQYGWPGRSLVGEDGADAAWLILQHVGSGVPTIGTPEGLAFQRTCLPILEDAVLKGEAHPRHLAHLADNLHARADEPPEFAVLISAYSVVDGQAVFTHPTDLAAIDRRRAEIGLSPFAEDVRRRSLAEPQSPTGAHRIEPWAR